MSKNKYGGINDTPTGWCRDNKRVYSLWFAMLRRCYDDEQQSRRQGRSYCGCNVCDRWLSLSNFAEDIKGLGGYSDWECGIEIVESIDSEGCWDGSSFEYSDDYEEDDE